MRVHLYTCDFRARAKCLLNAVRRARPHTTCLTECPFKMKICALCSEKKALNNIYLWLWLMRVITIILIIQAYKYTQFILYLAPNYSQQFTSSNNYPFFFIYLFFLRNTLKFLITFKASCNYYIYSCLFSKRFLLLAKLFITKFIWKDWILLHYYCGLNEIQCL